MLLLLTLVILLASLHRHAKSHTAQRCREKLHNAIAAVNEKKNENKHHS